MSQIGYAYEAILHSTDRVNGDDTASNFTVKLPNWVPNPKWNRIVLKQAQIDKVWYLIDDRHDTFTIDQNGSIVTVTIPEGNYSVGDGLASDILPVLQTAINSVSAPYVYTVSLEETTGLLHFTVSGNAGVQPIFIFTDDHLATVLGFERGSSNPFVADALDSTRVVQMQLAEGLIVLCDHAAPDRKLQAINAATQTWNAIQYTNVSPYLNAKVLSNTSEFINFQIVDQQDEEILDLNGHEVILTIGIYQDDPEIQYRMVEAIEKLVKIETLKFENEIRKQELELNLSPE